MPTLSFSCPKCDKLHERVKPEMVGHKVRCQCGFVFRLGSKADKQEWFVAELKRKKALKKKQQAESQGVNQPPETARERSFDLQPMNKPAHPIGPENLSRSNDILDAIPVASAVDAEAHGIPVAPLVGDSDDEVLDALPIVQQRGLTRPSFQQPVTVYPMPNQGVYPASPLMGDEVTAIPVGLLAESGPSSASAPDSPLAVAKPSRPSPKTSSRHSKQRKRSQPLETPAGPIWTLVLTFLGVPGLIVVMVAFASNALVVFGLSKVTNSGVPEGFGPAGGFGNQGAAFFNSGLMSGGLTVQMICSLGMFFLCGLLLIAMIITAVVAIMELANSKFIGWASKVSAIVASVVLACLFLLFFFNVLMVLNFVSRLEQEANITIDKSALGKSCFWLAFRYSLYGLVPLAVMITGFTRILKR